MKDFITDIVSGSLKRKVNKKQTTSKRDVAIYLSISSLISEGHKLTSNSKTVGAAAIVADMFCVSEDLATKAYSNTKKFREKFNKEFLEELYGKSEGASSMI